MKPELRSECCNGTVHKNVCEICDQVCTTYRLDDDQITIEASRHGKPIGFLIGYTVIKGEKGAHENGQQVTPDIDSELELKILHPKGYSLGREEYQDAYAIAEEKWMKLCEEGVEP